VPSKTDSERRDFAHWAAVEQAAELMHEQRYREALVELRGALRADPTNAYAYFFLGLAFFETGEIEAARDAHTACLKLAPAHLGARVALCHVLRILGDLRGAVRHGMAALSQAPGDGDALYALGLAHHARGDEAAAVSCFEAFLATEPEYDVAVETRALLATLRGEAAPNEDED
jgi:tetratricopeptide (TPR) repeat protein